MNNRDDFPKNVIIKIAERSGYICSNPTCNKITIGPCENNNEKSVKNGKAAHICAASPKGPRYDINQTENERKSITNAIWLCGSCADLIDKNNGVDYSKNILLEWKKKHEKIIKGYLEGKDKIYLCGNIELEEIKLAKHIIAFLEDRGVIFVELVAENIEFAILSIRDIRTFLTQIKGNIKNSGSKLENIITSMIHACGSFMNTTSVKSNNESFINNLTILRKSMGIYLSEMVNIYEIEVDEPLNYILLK